MYINFLEVVVKKITLVLLLWLCSCSLIFGQVSSSKRRLFNEASGTVGKQAPSDWIEHEGLFWKSVDILMGKDYIALDVNGNIVGKAIVGCLVADSRAQSRWLKESYDTLVADGWKSILDNGEGAWVLTKRDRMVSGVSTTTDDGTLSASVVFMKF
jgi:hypothetical protein